MSAIVAIHKENSLIVATDSRMRVQCSRNGEAVATGAVDGVRKMVPIGEDRVLVQGSKGGAFRPGDHPELMESLEGLTVKQTAERLADWSGEATGRSLYLYVAGIDHVGGTWIPTLAGVHGEGTQIQRQNNGVASVGMEMLIRRLTRPVMYPEQASGHVNPADFIDMPVHIDPSDLSVPEALDCAVFLLRFAGRFTEFLSGDDSARAMADMNVTLGENGRAVRTIAGPIHTCILLRNELEVARSFHTFGTPHKIDQTNASLSRE